MRTQERGCSKGVKGVRCLSGPRWLAGVSLSGGRLPAGKLTLRPKSSPRPGAAGTPSHPVPCSCPQGRRGSCPLQLARVRHAVPPSRQERVWLQAEENESRGCTGTNEVRMRLRSKMSYKTFCCFGGRGRDSLHWVIQSFDKHSLSTYHGSQDWAWPQSASPSPLPNYSPKQGSSSSV